MKYFLTIAASDNSGGAGIQQDLKVANELGFWGLSAITGVTVQNFYCVEKIVPVSAKILAEQIEINFRSFKIDAVKIGAICSEENIHEISGILKKYSLKNVVMDTVFAPSCGKPFIDHASIELFKEKLLNDVTIITPNKYELSLLANEQIVNLYQGIEAAKKITNAFKCSVFLKGGHFGDKMIREALIHKGEATFYEKERLEFSYSHGTGCAFSSALSCYLGSDYDLAEACRKAAQFVSSFYKKLNQPD